MSTKSARKRRNWNEMDEALEKEKKAPYEKKDGIEENLFNPKLKDDGTFQAIIRFLPRPIDDGNGVPFVKLYNHGFKDVGGWFIENCPTTLGDKCPVCSDNSANWATDEETSRKRGRRTSYYSNILVVQDPQTPENNGKVFIYRYGKTIHDMVMEKISPAEGSVDEKVHVHDYENGLNFRLKIKPKKGFNDYSSSQFVDTKTAIADTEEEIDAIDDQLYILGTIVEPEKFKTQQELEDKFRNVIGESSIEREEEKLNETVSETSSESEEPVGDTEDADAFLDTLKN